MLANNFASREFFAAFKLFEDGCDFSDLSHIRQETARQALGILYRRDKEARSRCCGGAQPKAFGALAKVQPVVGCAWEADGATLFKLPLLYIGWRVRDRVFPGIEIVELPLAGPAFNSLSQSQARESHRSGIRCVRLLRDLQQVEFASMQNAGTGFALSSKLIEESRRAIVVDVFDCNELFPAVYFSRLESIASGETSDDYFRECAFSEENLKWEFHQERVLFHPEMGMKMPLRMKTFAVRRANALAF